MLRRCLLAGTLAIVAAGCLWRGYASILSVHLDVLTGMADKLATLARADRGPAAEGMAEYVYPAKRARTFLRQFEGHSDRRSYARFAEFLDRYEALVRDVDRARALRLDWETQATHIEAERAALLGMAAEIREQLREGN